MITEREKLQNCLPICKMMVALFGVCNLFFCHQSGDILVLQNKKSPQNCGDFLLSKLLKMQHVSRVFAQNGAIFYIFRRRSISSLTYLYSTTDTNTKCNKLAKNTKESVMVADSYQPTALQIQSMICGNSEKNVQ